jgi:DNA modification methylase
VDNSLFGGTVRGVEIERKEGSNNMEAFCQSSLFTLYNADCLEVLKEMHSESIDLVCTDPPYG